VVQRFLIDEYTRQMAKNLVLSLIALSILLWISLISNGDFTDSIFLKELLDHHAQLITEGSRDLKFSNMLDYYYISANVFFFNSMILFSLLFIFIKKIEREKIKYIFLIIPLMLPYASQISGVNKDILFVFGSFLILLALLDHNSISIRARYFFLLFGTYIILISRLNLAVIVIITIIFLFLRRRFRLSHGLSLLLLSALIGFISIPEVNSYLTEYYFGGHDQSAEISRYLHGYSLSSISLRVVANVFSPIISVDFSSTYSIFLFLSFTTILLYEAITIVRYLRLDRFSLFSFYYLLFISIIVPFVQARYFLPIIVASQLVRFVRASR